MSQKKNENRNLYAVPESSGTTATPAKEMAISPEVCPKCYGTGMESVEGKGVRRCSCRQRDDHSKLLDKARIPRRYENCHFHSFERLNQSQERAFRFASGLTLDYPDVEKGLLLMGPVGVGKTHLAVSILKGLIERGFSCLFYEFGGLLKEIQSTYNPVSGTSEMNLMRPIFATEVLVLDEIGASKPTDWVRDTMANIINNRYNDKKLTIFTTNYLDGRADSVEETLEDRIGVRLRSRLFEMSKTVMIDGEDYRRKL